MTSNPAHPSSHTLSRPFRDRVLRMNLASPLDSDLQTDLPLIIAQHLREFGRAVRSAELAALCKEYTKYSHAHPNLRALLRAVRSDAPILQRYFQEHYPTPPSRADLEKCVQEQIQEHTRSTALE